MSHNLASLKQQLQQVHQKHQQTQFSGDSLFSDQLFGIRACELAVAAIEGGNYGVGALLLDRNNEIVAEASNQVFATNFRSSAHAEMCVLDHFEAQYPECKNRAGFTLLVTLEPCPMCLVRSMLAGVGHIRYLAVDQDGGMLRHVDKLPPAWRNLARLQSHQQALVSADLQQLAFDLAGFELAGIRKKVLANIRG